MYIYAQIDKDGYCVAVSQLNGEVVQSNLIILDNFDTSYINRKYDVNEHQWTDEYKLVPEGVDPIQEAIDLYTLNLVKSDLLK